MTAGTATISRADPREAKVRLLIEELDAYQQALYPAESNHLLDIETLALPQMRLYAVTVDNTTLACGGYWAHGDYAEVKRVCPPARSWAGTGAQVDGACRGRDAARRFHAGAS